MDILVVTPEAAPYVRVGGLGDVLGALPAELRRQGAGVRVMLPLYRCVEESWRRQLRFVRRLVLRLNGRRQDCCLYALERENVIWYFVENAGAFDRDNVYGYPDDGARFCLFCRAAAAFLTQSEWRPRVVFCHNWATALLPVYLRDRSGPLGDIRTVFTIHNIEYQGRFPLEEAAAFGVTEPLGEELNLMRQAIYAADSVTTVSPAYAGEIRDPAFAYGLHRAVEDNTHKLRGILNGLDLEHNDPGTDPALPANYGPGDMAGKAVCSAALRRELGLAEDPAVPVAAYMSQISEQKGFRLLLEALPRLMRQGLCLVICGSGEMELEQAAHRAARRWPGRVAVVSESSEARARQIYAGADMLLMPSRQEPCGLSQMIAMRYGTVPVVRETGGLRDTVRSWPAAEANGVSFAYFTVEDMMGAVTGALKLYREPAVWAELVRRGMCGRFGWEDSAREYMTIFRQITRREKE